MLVVVLCRLRNVGRGFGRRALTPQRVLLLTYSRMMVRKGLPASQGSHGRYRCTRTLGKKDEDDRVVN
jgi:hypothetical protein